MHNVGRLVEHRCHGHPTGVFGWNNLQEGLCRLVSLTVRSCDGPRPPSPRNLRALVLSPTSCAIRTGSPKARQHRHDDGAHYVAAATDVQCRVDVMRHRRGDVGERLGDPVRMAFQMLAIDRARKPGDGERGECRRQIGRSADKAAQTFLRCSSSRPKAPCWMSMTPMFSQSSER